MNDSITNAAYIRATELLCRAQRHFEAGWAVEEQLRELLGDKAWGHTTDSVLLGRTIDDLLSLLGITVK